MGAAVHSCPVVAFGQQWRPASMLQVPRPRERLIERMQLLEQFSSGDTSADPFDPL